MSIWNVVSNFFKKLFSQSSLDEPAVLPKKEETISVPSFSIMGVPLLSELVRVHLEPSSSLASETITTVEISTPPVIELTSRLPSEFKVDPFETVLPKLPDLEVWIDDGPIKMLKPDYWDVAKELGFKAAAFMIDTSNKGWDTSWTPKKYEKVGKLASDRGIKLITTIWPEPNKPYFAVAIQQLPDLLKAAGCHILESDMEFNWRVERNTFKTWNDANDEFLKFLDKVREQIPNLETELTTFTAHAENGKAAKAAPRVDRLVVQAYGIRKRPDGDLIPWDHVYSAGKMQTYTLDRTILVPGVKNGKPRVSVGLPAWDQSWPAHTEKEAMQVAREACLNYPHVKIESLRYWSSKWIFGARKSSYAYNFLKSFK